MLTGSCDETFNLWGYTDENGLTQELTSTGQDLGVVSMDVSPTGEFGATSSLDCVIRLVRIKTKEVEQIATIELPAPETWQVAYHPDPSREILGVAAGCVGGLRLYKSGVLDDGLKREICHIGPKPTTQASAMTTPPFALGCAFDPTGTKCAVSHSDGHIALYDVESQKHVLTFAGHSKPVRGLSFTADGTFLISACDDKTCNLYDTSSKNPIGSLNGHDSSVLCVERSGADGFCVTGSSDGGMKVWDLRNRSCVQTLSEHKEAVWSLALHEGAGRLASVSDDRSVCVYAVLQQ